MEETTPKVHRHRHRRSRSRQNQEQNTNNQNDATTTIASMSRRNGATTTETGRVHAATVERNTPTTNEETSVTNSEHNSTEPANSSSVQTVVLVNGHVLNDEDGQQKVHGSEEKSTPDEDNKTPELKRRTSDTLSLREILQQHRSGTSPSLAPSSHRRRTHSPSSSRFEGSERHAQRGITGFMDKESKGSSAATTTTANMASSVFSAPTTSTGGFCPKSSLSVGVTKKMQSLSDPQASPAQRSTRSRSSVDKSPRRKRSKSESRRRRERKLIAAGEMEVRQANETLMKYLKQCSEMNDASLSGELEIDHNYDERRVHRKTKSQRDKRGHLISKTAGKLYASGLSSILKEISGDIVPADGEDIYNPFTPVVSPTEDTPAHIEKIFIQTSSGYRPVDRCYYKNSLSPGGSGRNGDVVNISGFSGYSDTRCFLESQSDCNDISSSLQIACIVQQIWILISNICHGLLAGLALAHLLFVITNHPMEWTKAVINTSAENAEDNCNDNNKEHKSHHNEPMAIIEEYSSFAELYISTFYCLSIICVISVFDRIDICHLDFFHATESISFRWIIISMIYIATTILTIGSNSIDASLYLSINANVTLTQGEMWNHEFLSVWNSLSMARSLCAIFGWVMIGLTPHEDQLYENILEMAKHQLTNE